jgi:putative sigma-54 modulation protein
MEIRIESLDFNADQKLDDFVREKVGKLEKMYSRIENCTVKLRLEGNKENKNKIAEVLIGVPGTRLYAEDQAETFEEATDLAVNELKKQLEKHKSKFSHL